MIDLPKSAVTFEVDSFFPTALSELNQTMTANEVTNELISIVLPMHQATYSIEQDLVLVPLGHPKACWSDSSQDSCEELILTVGAQHDQDLNS